ncbi:hypothetical protein TthSNM11_16880 [Thermus thermophilus]|nr:hypothetical protein TthSNM11_16880 [Thermus thermophilus]
MRGMREVQVLSLRSLGPVRHPHARAKEGYEFPLELRKGFPHATIMGTSAEAATALLGPQGAP